MASSRISRSDAPADDPTIPAGHPSAPSSARGSEAPTRSSDPPSRLAGPAPSSRDALESLSHLGLALPEPSAAAASSSTPPPALPNHGHLPGTPPVAPPLVPLDLTHLGAVGDCDDEDRDQATRAGKAGSTAAKSTGGGAATGDSATSAPAADAVLQKRRTGTCKFFNAQKGFGFVFDHHPEELGGAEIFVHYTAISSKDGGSRGFRSLLEGEDVEFSIVSGPKGWQAQDVTGPHGRACIGSANVHHYKTGFSRPPPPLRQPSTADLRAAEGRGRRASGMVAGGYSSSRGPRLDSGFYSSGFASPADGFSAQSSPVGLPPSQLVGSPDGPYFYSYAPNGYSGAFQHYGMPPPPNAGFYPPYPPPELASPASHQNLGLAASPTGGPYYYGPPAHLGVAPAMSPQSDYYPISSQPSPLGPSPSSAPSMSLHGSPSHPDAYPLYPISSASSSTYLVPPSSALHAGGSYQSAPPLSPVTAGWAEEVQVSAT
ncbi:hypothetical protein JCM10212_007066 [Sporobolomyces blumeae]